jgi:hypothetical protein
MKPKSKLYAVSFILLKVTSRIFTRCKGAENVWYRISETRKNNSSSIEGRIDHLDVNVKDQVIYIAGLGNNTLEMVNLQQGKGNSAH